MAPLATRIRRGTAGAPSLTSALLGAALAVAYVAWAPPSADLAAAQHRSDLFARQGFSVWDNGWYGGHHLPGYSLFAPALGSLLSPRLVSSLSLLGATVLFARLAPRLVGGRGAGWASLLFCPCMVAQVLAGRVPFTLGVAVSLGALVALVEGKAALAISLGALTSMCSPVAGFFLALVGTALLLTTPGALPCPAVRRGAPHFGPAARRRHALGLVLAPAAPVLGLAVAFPEGGYEPLGFSALWPELLGAAAVAVVLALNTTGQRRRRWMVGDLLYGVACIGAFAVHSPLGSNVTRLGALLGAPLVGGALAARHRGLATVAAAAGLLWALGSPVADLVQVSRDPSVTAAYYRPLLAELRGRAAGLPVRVEIPLTGAHWEAARVGGQVSLARGWERQLDTRYAGLFYRRGLSAADYRAWLLDNAVAYVAVADVRLDFSAQAEARLIDGGLAYLTPVWRSRHWRLYAVRGATPLVSPPAQLLALGDKTAALRAPAAGTYTVRLRFTPYWALTSGHGCVAPAPGGWTRVATTSGSGQVALGVRFTPARVLASGPRCR